jgi:hypothetical protein
VSNIGVLLETLGGLDSMKIRTTVRAGRLLSDERRAQIKENIKRCGRAIRNAVEVGTEVVGAIA